MTPGANPKLVNFGSAPEPAPPARHPAQSQNCQNLGLASVWRRPTRFRRQAKIVKILASRRFGVGRGGSDAKPKLSKFWPGVGLASADAVPTQSQNCQNFGLSSVW